MVDTGSNMFYKRTVFISKQTNFNFEIGFGTGLNALLLFWKEENESINRLCRVEAYLYQQKNWFP
jgi:hypothetical protein